MAVAGVGIWIGLKIVLNVFSRCLDSVMKGPALQIIRILSRWSIPSTRLRPIALLWVAGLRLLIALLRSRSCVSSLLALHVLHRHEVAALECFAVGVAGLIRHLRMPKLLMRARVRSLMILEVLPRRLDPVVKGMALHVIRIFSRRRIPAALSLLIARRRTLRSSILR